MNGQATDSTTDTTPTLLSAVHHPQGWTAGQPGPTKDIHPHSARGYARTPAAPSTGPHDARNLRPRCGPRCGPEPMAARVVAGQCRWAVTPGLYAANRHGLEGVVANAG